MAKMTEVPGNNKKHQVVLYALSTCIWCKKTKELLDDLDVHYRYVFVDLLAGKDEQEVMDQVREFNPGCTFPTMVIDNKKVIVGLKEPEIKKVLA
ncbi:MAG: glutaredoxin family protein [bacterium]|nr:glutaredoxin family protein [bacterium]